MGEPGIVDLSPPVLLAFAYTVVVVAFVSYIAWFWLVRNYPPTRVTAFTFLSPVFGVLAGNLMLGEAFTPSLAVALALIAFGIYLVNRPPEPSLTLSKSEGGAARMLPNERLSYSAIIDRPPLALPGGARLAVWVIVNVEEWDIACPCRARCSPAGRRLADARHPELGLARVRQPRRLLAHARGVRRAALPATLAINGSAIAPTSRSRALPATRLGVHGPRLTQTNMQKVENEARGHRAHDRSDRRFAGRRPRGWLGPGLTETWETPDLLVEAGYEYVCDWVLDDQPVVLKTRAGPSSTCPTPRNATTSP